MQCTGAAGIVTLTKQSIPAATVIAGRSWANSDGVYCVLNRCNEEIRTVS